MRITSVSVAPGPIGSLEDRVLAKLAEAERKAWLSLAGYKFIMFGYWAAQWVLLRSCAGPRPNPFRVLVSYARQVVAERGYKPVKTETADTVGALGGE